MGHHRKNANANINCESFVDYEDEVDLLQSVMEWWKERSPQYAHANLEHITVHYDDDGCSAEVFWVWLSPEMVERLNDEFTKQRPLKIETKQIGTN